MKDLMKENKCECCKTNARIGKYCYNCGKYLIQTLNQRIEIIEEKLKEVKKCV